MKKKEVEGNQMDVYDKLIPIARFLDWITFRKIGLSIIALATKR